MICHNRPEGVQSARAGGDPHYVTLWQIGGIAFGLMVYPIAWFWGGRQERLGAGLLLFSCLLSMVAYYSNMRWAPLTSDWSF